MKDKKIIALGYDLSTTALSAVGRTEDGEEIFASIPMRGATAWHGQPAFDLKELPGLFTEALGKIKAQGFEFARGGVISGSVRQHDLVVLGVDGRFLMPALSWQCNAATEEVERLKATGAEDIVGRLEPRLILPKLLWAVRQEAGLKNKIRTVMTTGDFIARQLTGALTLCSSEGLSNGLLVQNKRTLAWRLIDSFGDLNSSWFPPVVKSGLVIAPKSDTIQSITGVTNKSPDWDSVRALLPDWRVVAGLGDNHAGAVGSGLVGRQTMVVSAGTSGTVTRAVKLGVAVNGGALQFEYYEDTLLLMMMADCASWYNRFVAQFARGLGHTELNGLALAAQKACYLDPPETWEAPFPVFFTRLTLGEQARGLQFSIAVNLAALCSEMRRELTVVEADHVIECVVLTGGLTASPYFCQALKRDLRDRDFNRTVQVSSRVGPLANQAATLGALINALVGGGLYPNLESAIKGLCPTREI